MGRVSMGRVSMERVSHNIDYFIYYQPRDFSLKFRPVRNTERKIIKNGIQVAITLENILKLFSIKRATTNISSPIRITVTATAVESALVRLMNLK